MYTRSASSPCLFPDKPLFRPSWLYDIELLPRNEEIYLLYSNRSFPDADSIIEHISNGSMPSALQIVGVAAGSASAIVAVAGFAYTCYKCAKAKYDERQSRQQQQQDARDVLHRLPYILETTANICDISQVEANASAIVPRSSHQASLGSGGARSQSFHTARS